MRASVLICAVLCASCAAKKPLAKAPPAADPDPPAATDEKVAASDPAKEKQAPAALPTECKQTGEVCTPDSKWVDRLCSGNYPDVALILFQKGSPWTRGYLRGKVKAWNASGGASTNGELEFDEEVLMLRFRGASSGCIQGSGASGNYDALRWDGACVSLAQEEVTLKRAPSPKSAGVEWKLLAPATRDALQADATVDAAYKKRKNECKGATMGEVSRACEVAHKALSRLIVGWVRDGGKVPVPERLP